MKITAKNIITFFHHYRWLCLILALAAFLLFFHNTHVDLIADDAHYTTRAIGMVDLMFAYVQSTPILWYIHLPWWTYLSWHDHPMLLFYIQHLFLSDRPNLSLVKLPYALMALGTIILTYAWTKKLFGERVALVAALLLALDAHFIAMGRTALMESGVMFFISLAIYTFLIFYEQPKYWWLFGISLGLMLESKFTTLFIIPLIIIYAAIADRRIFRNTFFYGAFGMAALLFAPVIIYNIGMYLDRGHFALQMTRLLHQTSPWAMSGVNSITAGVIFGNIVTLGGTLSWPYFDVFSLALIYILVRHKRKALFLLLGFGLVFFEDITIGTRGLSSLFIAPIAALAAIEFYQTVQTKTARRGLLIGGIIFSLYLLGFTINSNLMSTAWGTEGWAHDALGRRNYGGYQLNNYLDTLERTVPDLGRYDEYESLKIRQPSLARYITRGPSELNGRTHELKKIIIFDQNILWFSQLWLFARRGFYTDLAIFSTREVLPEVRSYLSPQTVYFIKATDKTMLDPSVKLTTAAADFEAPLIAAHFIPKLIYRDDGKVAFKVYEISDPAILAAYGFAY